MITVKIQGGLGNQLFQYAFGRQLALAHNVELLLDTTIYEDYPFHEYGLGVFVIAEQFATKEAVAAFKKVKPRKGRRNIVYNALFADPHEYIVERKFSYDASIQKEGPNAYFDGYWQTEKYFAGIEEIIRKDFTLKVPLSEHGKYAAEIIRNTTAISLHVRRGLYVSHPVFSAIHGACTPEYFKNAIDYISSRVENPHFFIFSDDQAWARENIKPNFQTTYMENPQKGLDYEDIILMSMCKHHILANSTFSWWGAWLNPDKDKIVVGPKNWFKIPRYNQNTPDILPEAWIRL